MKNDLEEKRVHGSLLFPFQYYTAEQGRHGRPEIFVACHWHDDVEILTVAKGTLQIMVDGRELRGEEGDIFFFNSGQIHQIQGNGRWPQRKCRVPLQQDGSRSETQIRAHNGPPDCQAHLPQ